MSFDPRAHRLVPVQRWFEDFTLGERFPLPSRTMTSGLFAAFQAASGDNHPIHYDAEYCKAHGLPGMLAHGYQVAIQSCAGAGLFPHMVEDSLKGFLEQSTRFLHPVVCDDTLYPMLEVDEITPQTTTGIIGLGVTIHNQHGIQVLAGRHRYLLRKRPA